MSLRRILFLIVLIASPLMVSDARMASAFDRPIRCPFYAPTGQMVPCREYWPYVRAHEGQVQSAQGHWGCRAINGRVGGRTWGLTSRADAASRALAICGRADCHIIKCSPSVRTAADAQVILVDNSAYPGWHYRQ